VSVAVRNQKLGPQNRSGIRLVTPWFIEYGFYAFLVYGAIGPFVGVQIDRLGIVFLAGLAFLCFLGYGERARDFFKLLVFPIGLGFSYIFIQYMYHDISFMNHEYVKPFIPWMFTLLVVQALSFRRGFLHRYAVLVLMIGVALLPFLRISAAGEEIARASIGGGLGGANGLGNWFGFCAVYFFVFGVVSRRQKIRLASWMITTGCLFIVTLTVSRGALIAAVIAIVLASREFLKRGFLPVMLLVILGGIAYVMGVFDQAIISYSVRATEETGRSFVWPRAFEMFLDSPLTGVGASQVKIFMPRIAMVLTPHNTFLFLAVAGGIVPLIFYTAYWIQAILSAALKPRNGIADHTSFALPLVIFSILISLLGNLTFMKHYVIVSIAIALVSHRRTPRAVIDKQKRRELA
jgi:O-antigen ligase